MGESYVLIHFLLPSNRKNSDKVFTFRQFHGISVVETQNLWAKYSEIEKKK